MTVARVCLGALSSGIGTERGCGLGIADLGAGAPGSTIAGQLGNVAVSGLRGANPVAWTARVSSTDFPATGVPAIPASDVTYIIPGTATATTYSATVTHSVA